MLVNVVILEANSKIVKILEVLSMVELLTLTNKDEKVAKVIIIVSHMHCIIISIGIAFMDYAR